MVDYELNARWVDVTQQCLPTINDIVRNWEIINGQKTNNIEYIVLNVSEFDFQLLSMARNGEPFKLNERKSKTLSLTALQENEFKLLDDKSNDKSKWPGSVDEAVKILNAFFERNQVKEVEQMTWEEFSLKYVELGSLGNWIRNYFGLWRGNYDLMLDCEISERNADNVSTHISYCLWEYITNKKS